MRRTTLALVLAGALVMAAGLVPMSPAHAIPPPPTLLCANDFSTANLTGWSQSGGRWTVADGTYQQTARTSSNARSWFQAEWFAHSATARVKLVSASRSSSFVAFNIGVRGASTSYRLVLSARSVARLESVRDGAVTVLASQALPVAAGTWYTINMGQSQTQISALVDGAWLFGGTVNLPAGAHHLGGVGFTTAHASGAFDDLTVIHYGPSTEPRCPTTPPA